MKKRLTVLALAFAMVLTMSASVFAENGQNAPNPNNVHDTAAADAYLVKYMQVANGITLPTETFTFNFAPAASKSSDYAVPVGTDGFVATSATIAVADMAHPTGDAAGPKDADNNNQVGKLSIASIFADYDFPRAGEYSFTVTEALPEGANAETREKTTTADGKTSIMKYSSESYTLHLVVDRNHNIDDVTIQEGADGDKVDATDVKPGDNEGGATPADSNGGFTFTNKFTKRISKHDEPTTPNPDVPEGTEYDPENPPTIPDGMTSDQGAFELDKYVLGEYGDTTKAFNFTVTVNLPDTDKDFNYSADTNVVGTTALKDGEVFKYKELPMGTKITVAETEANQAGYKTHWKSSQGDNVVADILVGEDGAYVICRNAFDDESITPTGIIINNLPYVLLIAIALGGIVLFSRKRRYE